jgi:hypothetical protein
MTVADKTPTTQYVTMHVTPLVMRITNATQNDTITISSYKGVWPITGPIVTTSANALQTYTYGDASINNASTAYGTTDTSIVIQGASATKRATPYYLATSSGEILEVIADSAPTAAGSTLTVRRGVLGTTASATGLANTNHVTILNQIVLTSSTVGAQYLMFFPMPNDDGTACFSG